MLVIFFCLLLMYAKAIDTDDQDHSYYSDIYLINKLNRAGVKTETLEDALFRPRFKRREMFPERFNFNKTHWDPKKNFFLTEYKYYAKHYGKQILATSSKWISKEFKILEKEMIVFIKPISKEYTEKVDNLFKNIPEVHRDSAFDILVLDTVIECLKLLALSKNDILQVFVDRFGKFTPIVSINYINTTLLATSLIDKKHAMAYVCEMVSVCKIFPSFVDYLSEQLMFFLELPDKDLLKNFENAVHLIKLKATPKMKFTREAVKLLNTRLAPYYQNANLLKETISSLLSQINNRYAKVITKDEKEINVTKALRMLFDIMDKAFALDVDYIFQTVLKDVTFELFNLEDILNNILSRSIQSAAYAWNNFAREEVGALIEIILTGVSKDTRVFNYLHKSGSRFLKDNGSTPDLDEAYKNRKPYQYITPTAPGY